MSSLRLSSAIESNLQIERFLFPLVCFHLYCAIKTQAIARLEVEGASMLFNVISKQGLVIFIGVSLGALFALITPSISEAAPIEIFIATEYSTDVETGMKSPAALNPSGKADITYMNNGIVLTFEGNNGKSNKVKIHLDFERLLDADSSNRSAAIETFDAITKNGPLVLGKIISTIAASAKKSGQSLSIMLDARRSPGFLKTDFDLGQVRIVTSGGENVRLQILLAEHFLPTRSQVDSSQGVSESGSVPVKTCEGQFVTLK
jgi:hypothetical protein